MDRGMVCGSGRNRTDRETRRSHPISLGLLLCLVAAFAGCEVRVVDGKLFGCDLTDPSRSRCPDSHACQPVARSEDRRSGVCWPVGAPLDCDIVKCDFDVLDAADATDAADTGLPDACSSDACADTNPCGAGEAQCDGTSLCIDLTANRDHCGTCGNACTPGSLCVAGTCRCGDGPACENNLVCCAGACHDPTDAACVCGSAPCQSNDEVCCTDTCAVLESDPAHCGGCGLTCPSGDLCTNGVCTCNGEACPADADHATLVECRTGGCYLECETGLADCDDDARTGCETGTRTSASHCGVCGNACGASGAGCDAGLCDPIVEVAAGLDFACGRHASGRVACWGSDLNGTLGNGAPPSSSNRPVALLRAGGLPVENAVAIDAQALHGCLVDSTGSVGCWGAHTGDAGSDPAVAVFDGFPPASAGNVVATEIAVGQGFACALGSNEKVFCWGENDQGQLGNGSASPSHAAAVEVSGVSGVRAIAAGADHACALTQSNTLFCWGANSNGQLGLDDLTPRLVATQVATDASSVDAGTAHTCAATATGLQCWGSNKDFRMGIDDSGTCALGCTYQTPQSVDLSCSVVELALGPNHTCARCEESGTFQVHCWGDNTAGAARGDGTTGDKQKTPLLVGSLQGVTGLALGNLFSCAAHDDGHVSCWGAGLMGQLGLGSDITSPTPVRVVDLP